MEELLVILERLEKQYDRLEVERHAPWGGVEVTLDIPSELGARRLVRSIHFFFYPDGRKARIEFNFQSNADHEDSIDWPDAFPQAVHLLVKWTVLAMVLDDTWDHDGLLMLAEGESEEEESDTCSVTRVAPFERIRRFFARFFSLLQLLGRVA